MFVVYLPPLKGKLEGWLRSTIFTTYRDRASTYATREAAQAAIDKARKFHLARVIRALQVHEVHTETVNGTETQVDRNPTPYQQFVTRNGGGPAFREPVADEGTARALRDFDRSKRVED